MSSTDYSKFQCCQDIVESSLEWNLLCTSHRIVIVFHVRCATFSDDSRDEHKSPPSQIPGLFPPLPRKKRNQPSSQSRKDDKARSIRSPCWPFSYPVMLCQVTDLPAIVGNRVRCGVYVRLLWGFGEDWILLFSLCPSSLPCPFFEREKREKERC